MVNGSAALGLLPFSFCLSSFLLEAKFVLEVSNSLEIVVDVLDKCNACRNASQINKMTHMRLTSHLEMHGLLLVVDDTLPLLLRQFRWDRWLHSPHRYFHDVSLFCKFVYG